MSTAHRSPVRSGILAVLVAAASVALALPASGGLADPGLQALQFSTAIGPPGTQFTVSGVGCTNELFGALSDHPGGIVTIVVGFSPPITQAAPAAAGTGIWSITFTVPPGTAPGPYPVTATCAPVEEEPTNGGAVASVVAFQTPSRQYPVATFTVTAPATAPAPAPVPIQAAPRTTG